MSDGRWVILKFGGTSVSTGARWRTIARLVRERQEAGLRPLVVCSAVRGVSDLLEALALRRESVPAALERLRTIHVGLAGELGVDPAVLDAPFASLEHDLEQVAALEARRETPPALVASIMRWGEVLSTQLGADALVAAGIDAAWVDARDLLEATPPSATDHPSRRWLSASCAAVPDASLSGTLDHLLQGSRERVPVTQGFVVRDVDGGTALLGRGGSDTSAAYLAAKLSASACEIWTDVPGLFSANPHLVPTARLLRHLHYEEAEEIALAGAKVLHPRCIGPLWQQDIPLHLRWTDRPEAPGTLVDSHAGDTDARLKALALRRGVTLLSLDTVGMWHQVGFLADAFGIFRRHGISVDQVATSEANVTVSLDPGDHPYDEDAIEALVADLRRICVVEIVRPCAALSMVGRHIRSLLHQLAPAFEVFEEERVHLITQAAKDLNLTLAVDDSQAERLLQRLHAQLFPAGANDELLGPTWQELERGEDGEESLRRTSWWVERRDELLAHARERSPVYVYDAATVRARASELTGLASADRVFYALKANPHPEVLRQLESLGVGFECASAGELDRVLEVLPDLARDRILFTPNFAPREELARALAAGTWLTLDALYPLESWPELFRGRELLVRLDPGRGDGHHKHVHTAGHRTKFGVSLDQLDRLSAAATKADATIVGLHAHVGSGIREPARWLETADALAAAAERFPDVRILDLGGGLAVPERPGQPRLDLAQLDSLLGEWRSRRGDDLELWLEPGRYLASEAGVLLVTVTQLKEKRGITYVGVDTGMNSLLRPALYGAFHDIVNLTRYGEPATVVAEIVGPLCESGDVLGHARALPPPREGDVLLVATAGAYGHSMSNHYNLREPAREVVLT